MKTNRTWLVSKATVISISNASDTVKTLSLKVAEKNVSFKAGQWVDLTIPGVEEVGGFSICSSPMKLQMCGIVDLAVQASDASPSTWVHSNVRSSSAHRD
ncbi:PREDICTED: oxidoreductase NAD-binding domain-containing protein 1-like, partial [Priapulus caudatus]|uniref:Oxidoreductase NAD-binding domain-containing protein 1-like n=1 Tax=Priapulus caudatus TaxID=37621 RepID=A0ABM1ENF0_PRICU